MQRILNLQSTFASPTTITTDPEPTWYLLRNFDTSLILIIHTMMAIMSTLTKTTAHSMWMLSKLRMDFGVNILVAGLSTSTTSLTSMHSKVARVIPCTGILNKISLEFRTRMINSTSFAIDQNEIQVSYSKKFIPKLF